MRRLFIDTVLSDKIIITGGDALHLLYAMRAKPGQHVIVADKNGSVADTEIVSCQPQKVFLRLIGKLDSLQNESPAEIVLVQCLPKSDKMDYIVQKAVELGVSRIVPMISHNCVVKYDDNRKEKHRQKWQKIADEAAKQCGRNIRPQVEKITDIAKCIEMAGSYNACVCYENEENISIRQYLAEQNNLKYMVVIGPEGGFTPQEIERLCMNGIKAVSLGKRILRTETAAIAALTVIQYEKGDLGNR